MVSAPFRISLLILSGLAIPSASGTETPPAGPSLRVAPEGWGEARPEDVSRVLESVVRELRPLLPARSWPTLVIESSRRGPILLHERTPEGHVRILLDVQGRYWAQLAFQFAHELTHLSCHADSDPDPHDWLEESICEMASIHVLRQMAKTWKHSPPYPNWRDYSDSLERYARRRLESFELPEGTGFLEWFRRNESDLRRRSTDRKRNGIVARQLLAHFEASPRTWRILPHLNRGRPRPDETLAEFLRRLRPFVAVVDRQWLEQLAAVFGQEI